MAKALLMPKQGNSVESCMILEWVKKEGDAVRTGDTVCEAETDKATIEVEATADGTLLKIVRAADEDVPVQSIIAVIGEPGEDISSILAEAGSVSAAEPNAGGQAAAPVTEAETLQTAAVTVNASASVNAGGSRVSPRARNLAAASGADPSSLTGTGPGGRVIERDVAAALNGKQPLSPAAVAAAIEKGLAAPASGSGIGGRVLSSDLQPEAAIPAAAIPAAASAASAGFPGSFRDEKVKGVRKITAQRMMQSLGSTAQLTHSFSARAEGILGYRRKLKNSPQELGLGGITINDIIMYIVSRVLKQNPQFNAHWYGDSIRYFESVHLGFAVDTPKGLLVPVVKNADSLSLRQLYDETNRLVSACRDGKAQPEDLEGATFTISNVGAFGIESFTPIVNPPEVAILGVCSSRLQPVRTPSGIEYADYMGFSLTYDHQATDGAPASRFCAAVRDAVENFDIYLAG